MRMVDVSTPQVLTGRAAVLALVKREGPISADALAGRLKLTATAVRQHLQGLAEEGLVASEDAGVGGARGRPAKRWRTTGAADARFVDAHAALTGELIGQMRRAFGEEGLDRLLALRTADQAEVYQAEIGPQASLRGRLRKVMPKNLTKHAAASAAARASIAPTAGTMIFNAHCGRSGLCSTAWNINHSETKPLNGGSAEIATQPTRTAKLVNGMR